ncbi:MAG: slipin family protein [Bacteroidota bacterium]
MFRNQNIAMGKIGLVFRRGQLDRVLTAGQYTLWGQCTVQVYDMSVAFRSAQNLNLLLKNADLASKLEVVRIGDDEIVIRYEDDVFAGVLTSGTYAYWKGLVTYRFDRYDRTQVWVDEALSREVLARAELAQYVVTYTVAAGQRGVLFLNGKFTQELAEGVYFFWKNANRIEVRLADLRQQSMEISGQEMLTKDKAALRLNFTVQYRIADVVEALVNNLNVVQQMYNLGQLALREVVGSMTLDELLEQKEAVSGYVTDSLNRQANGLGIEMGTAGVKDIILTGEMRNIMNQVLVAQKQAQAQVILRREETASTRSLLNTAKLMEDNQMLYKLKEMEYVERIADKINTISVGGGDKVLDQLKTIFGVNDVK